MTDMLFTLQMVTDTSSLSPLFLENAPRRDPNVTCHFVQAHGKSFADPSVISRTQTSLK